MWARLGEGIRIVGESKVGDMEIGLEWFKNARVRRGVPTQKMVREWQPPQAT